MKKKEVIFFWIPKNAGSSIYKILKENGCNKLKYEYENFNNKGMITFSHVSILYLLKKKYINQEYFEKSFKFCFARNPWDRTVSIYYYLKYNKEMSFKEFVYFLQKKFESKNSLRGKFFKFINKFPDIIFRITNRLAKNFNFITPIPPIGKYNVRDLSQANLQTDWILDKNNNLMVDFIGKTENIDEDLKKCFDIIGIKINQIPHTNKTKHKDYKNYYNKETKKIIEKIYKKDIEYFNYRF